MSEVKEVMRALTTLSNKPEAMQTFKDKRAAAIQMYAQRSQGIDPWVDWHMMSRSNHKDDLTKLHEERIKAFVHFLPRRGLHTVLKISSIALPSVLLALVGDRSSNSWVTRRGCPSGTTNMSRYSNRSLIKVTAFGDLIPTTLTILCHSLGQH